MAHVIAASLVVLVNAGHSDPENTSNLLQPVQRALEIFETYSTSSDLAKKGIIVLQSLIMTVESPSTSSGDDLPPGDFVGSAGKDLKRAIGILRRKPDLSLLENENDDGLPGPGSSPPSSKRDGTLTSASISPEEEMPLWKSDWAASTSIATSSSMANVDPLLEMGDTEHGLSGLQTEDLFDTLFGLGDDSGMWDYRGLDLG